jgi:hypothetical protein
MKRLFLVMLLAPGGRALARNYELYPPRIPTSVIIEADSPAGQMHVFPALDPNTLSGTETFTGNGSLQGTWTAGAVATIDNSPTGATESGNTVAITTTAPCPFVTGQSVNVSGVSVAGYNSGLNTRWVVLSPGCNGTNSFTYTNPTSGLAASGGGTVTGSTIFSQSITHNGQFLSSDGSSTTWIMKLYPKAVKQARFMSIAATGQNPGVAGYGHTMNGSVIGTVGACVADNTAPTLPCYGMYSEAVAMSGVGPHSVGGIVSNESDPVEFNNFNDAMTPYAFGAGNITPSYWAACGGEHSSTFDCTAALVTNPNTSKFHSGIVIRSGSITGDSSADAEAIAMGKFHALHWYEPTTGTEIATIYSTINDATAGKISQTFRPHQLSLIDSSSTSTKGFGFLPGAPSGFGNPLVQTGDAALIANGSGIETGAVFFGSNSNSNKGMRMNASGAFGFGANPASTNLGDVEVSRNLSVDSGITNNKGLQIFNTTTTCRTAASVGATCTTAAVTLPVAEADTSYRVVCVGKGITNVPVVIATTNSSASQFTITIAAITAAAATFTSYDCTAGHN